jgi:hypothetical protein
VNAKEMVTRLWELANENPSKDMGNAGQKSAFKLLLEVEGGIGFIAKRPAEEVEVLGACAHNLLLRGRPFIMRYQQLRPPDGKAAQSGGSTTLSSIGYFKVTSRASEVLRVGAISLRFFAASSMAWRLP